jgi:chemotaxis protein CheY-P-specific phosphatase CheC
LDQRAIIDVICKAGLENLSGEIGALLGQDLICSDIELDVTSKAHLFSNPEREKTAFTRMTIGGDQEGSSYLLTRLSTAAVLAGTLIMLPEDMIEENVQSGTLDGELNDAFGEVANIIAGVFTQAFVDKYSKTLRFIKQTVEELIPTKVDLASEEPFPPGNYYVASCQLAIGDKLLGPLELVVPATIFELETEEVETSESDSAQEASEVAPQSTEQPPVSSPQVSETPPLNEPAVAAAPKPAFADSKKLTDVVFNATISQASEEMGALLGQTLSCDDIKLVMTSKAEFFSNHCIDKSILAHLKVTGDKEGLGFMLVQVPDAVVMGGTLIMLPDDQIEELRNSGSYEGEVADAFGEIANILAGSLTQVFLDRYPKQLRFIRTDIETVVPTKIDPASNEPFTEGSYYLVSFAIQMEGFDLHRIQLIFPADIFDLDHVQPETAQQQAQATDTPQATNQPKAVAANAEEPAPGEWGGPPLPGAEKSGTEGSSNAVDTVGGTNRQQTATPAGPPVVLVISDQEQNPAPFAEILSSAGYDCHSLSYQDELKDLFQKHQILGIFLVMAQVGERGFATAIKLQAAGRPLPPIIFAGPEWTKSAVLRAVKYGAKDILVMPASTAEIQDKVSLHIKKAS